MSAGGVSITLSCADGRSLEELSRLIELRCKRLGETSADATAAVLINVLASLRALTTKASPSKKVDARIVRLNGVRVGRRRDRTPCLKQGGAEWNPDCRVVYLTARVRRRDKDLSAFFVTPEHENVRPYIVVTESEASARQFEEKAGKHRKRDYAGLAKTALGIAMAKISTRNAPTAEFKRKIADSELVSVSNVQTPDGAVVEIRDRLGYAALALKGGSAAVDLAMKKAANRITHNLVAALNRAGDFAFDLKSPFPEVKNRRAK